MPHGKPEYLKPIMVALALFAASSAPAMAQNTGNVSRPVVQALPPPASNDLNAALLRLARNPEDAGALVDAGNASLKVGDIEAAIGFFSRADMLQPGNARAKAGLGSAHLRAENPFDALLMFDEAEKAGIAPVEIAADRGLAYDLVGDSLLAQELYRLALSKGGDDEIKHRLSLSLAISGDRKGAEEILRPMLDRQDLGAFRTWAFGLAILGDTKGAMDIARVRLPSNVARSMEPYLRYMPRLTSAQQAAAANFGHFPKAADIGRDDPRIASRGPVRTRKADSALQPEGEPLGGKLAYGKKESRAEARRRLAQEERARKEQAKAEEEARAKAEAEQKARIEALAKAEAEKKAQAEAEAEALAKAEAEKKAQAEAEALAKAEAEKKAQAEALAQAEAQSRAQALAQARAVAAEKEKQAALARAEQAAATTAKPSLSVLAPDQPSAGAGLASAPPVSPIKAPVAEPATGDEAASKPDFAATFAEFSDIPDRAGPPAGAVDVLTIKPRRDPAPEPVKPPEEPAAKTPAKAAAKPKAEPAKPAHPSRVWVQIATGRDRDALAYDWRRMSRRSPDLFKGHKPYIAKWGQTNRMVVGPFANAAEAQTYLAKLKAAEIDSFIFTSKDDEAVDLLSSGK